MRPHQPAALNTLGIRQANSTYQLTDEFGFAGIVYSPGIYWTRMIYSPVKYYQAFARKDIFWWYGTPWD